MNFAKAVKTESKLRLAIMGPSGAGKTYTALAIASNMGGKVAVVDTEHGSASKYADAFDFDVMSMGAPYHPDRFGEAIRAAAQAGYSVIILDSLTHAWNGTGGMLELVDEFAKRNARGGSPNTFSAWKDATPIQNRLIESIVGAPIHVIATMRSKQDYVQDTGANGRAVIRKVGMAAQQREGFEYEFDVVLDMDIDHNGVVTKSRASNIADRVFAKPGKDVAKMLLNWLQGEAPVVEGTVNTASANTIRQLHAAGKQYYGDAAWKADGPSHLEKMVGKRSPKDMTEDEAQSVIAELNKAIAELKAIADETEDDDDRLTYDIDKVEELAH